MSFADLKRSSTSNFEKLNKELSKLNTSTGNKSDDDRWWKPEVDKAGNGYAIIRFLPAPEGEDFPFVRIWDHGFQGPGGWYIENSLTTIGQEDPLGKINSALWNSGIESDKDIARKQKRRLSYYSNIYVVKDPAHPENEGKTFLYKFGKKIFDKINDMMNPAFEDEKPVNPFDLWSGANFKLKIRNVEGYRNYDKSEFDTPGPLLEDDAELEAIYKAEHSLQAFLDPKNFKSYAELEAKLNKALGKTGTTQRMSIPEEDMPSFKEEPVKKNTKTAEPKNDPIADDDDDLAFFQRLADED